PHFVSTVKKVVLFGYQFYIAFFVFLGIEAFLIQNGIHIRYIFQWNVVRRLVRNEGDFHFLRGWFSIRDNGLVGTAYFLIKTHLDRYFYLLFRWKCFCWSKGYRIIGVVPFQCAFNLLPVGRNLKTF